jgi:hypothetical protein
MTPPSQVLEPPANPGRFKVRGDYRLRYELEERCWKCGDRYCVIGTTD